MNPPDFTTPDIATVPKFGDAPPPPVKPGTKGKMIGQNISVVIEECGESSSTPVGNQGTSKPEATLEELMHQIAHLQEELVRRQAETAQQHLLKAAPVQAQPPPLLQATHIPNITPKRRRE